ncbi:MAG TPA: heme-binding protein [Cellvibrionaceae bacterium]|nr:heme-binding protein [Cellvibrionaceae bacterium]HNG60964.1 heme-binding protein [Cellvibrionaceae bacterium]
MTIEPGIEVVIQYQSGTWTADPHTNGGQLYDANGDLSVIVPENQTSYPIVGVAMGSLVGRVNGGTPFLIGAAAYAILSAIGGPLELCINDDLTGQYGAGLTDNEGSLTIGVTVYANANTAPDLSQPLAREPAQQSPAVPPANLLGPLQYLIGTWTNKNLPGTTKGGPDSPYSYNVMPLPQIDPSSPTGYILKNFSYYEELTFTAIHGNAPNRGGSGQQVAYTLFYEQRVYFAEGPNKDALVHAENGSLLYLLDTVQPLGPYGNGDQPGLGSLTVQNSVAPTQQFNLVKQVSVPHGNSILALGNYASENQMTGVPIIPAASPLPSGVNTAQYAANDPVSNPQPALTANPNQVLTNALEARPCSNFLKLAMSSANGKGIVTNIGFEQQHANVSQYDFTYWLEAFDGTTDYTQLQYTQTITLQIPINGQLINFPHVTANTLTKSL